MRYSAKEHRRRLIEQCRQLLAGTASIFMIRARQRRNLLVLPTCTNLIQGCRLYLHGVARYIRPSGDLQLFLSLACSSAGVLWHKLRIRHDFTRYYGIKSIRGSKHPQLVSTGKWVTKGLSLAQCLDIETMQSKSCHSRIMEYSRARTCRRWNSRCSWEATCSLASPYIEHRVSTSREWRFDVWLQKLRGISVLITTFDYLFEFEISTVLGRALKGSEPLFIIELFLFKGATAWRYSVPAWPSCFAGVGRRLHSAASASTGMRHARGFAG